MQAVFSLWQPHMIRQWFDWETEKHISPFLVLFAGLQLWPTAALYEKFE